MDIQKQVISLEIARKLKKFGVKQESIWAWVDFNLMGGVWELMDSDVYKNTKIKQISAFTVAELGEMLPRGYYSVCDYNDNPNWICWKFNEGKEKNKEKEMASTEANVRAKMLIYLLENRLIKL